MVQPSRLSGARCVERLRELGFEVVRDAFGMTLLRRGDRRVMVPGVETIEPDMLRAILRSAGVSESELFRRRIITGSGIYPRTANADRADRAAGAGRDGER